MATNSTKLFATLTVLGLLASCQKDPAGADGTTLQGELCQMSLPGEIAVSFEVDCTGLSVWPITTSSTFAESRLAIYQYDSADTQLKVDATRCSIIFFEPLATPLQPLGLHDDNPGSAGLALYDHDTVWATYDGCMKLDQYETEPRKGVGRYEAVLVEKTLGNKLTGRFGRARGAIDWCAYGKRADCPIQIDTRLTRKATYRAPLVVTRETSGEDLVNECRVLIDKATQGVQVDLEMATKGGIPVTQLEPVCNPGQPHIARANSFVFRAGGVPGPGVYGPLGVNLYGGVALPQVTWTMPKTWDANNPSEYCSTMRGEQLQVELSEEASCSWEIQENPGRFTLKCAEAIAVAQGARGGTQRGPLELSADCDVRYR